MSARASRAAIRAVGGAAAAGAAANPATSREITSRESGAGRRARFIGAPQDGTGRARAGRRCNGPTGGPLVVQAPRRGRLRRDGQGGQAGPGLAGTHERCEPWSRRPKRSKTALVLGGGGFTGGVYEIGALRALDLLSVNRTVNQFDVYVGTSAGSFVAALAANGITPEEMMRVVNQQVPTPFRDIDVGDRAAPQPARVRAHRRAAPLADRQPRPRASRRSRRSISAMDIVLGPGRGPAVGPLHRLGHRAVRARRPVGPRPHRRLPRARATSCTSSPPTWTPASGSSSAPRAGTTSRSPPPCARRPRCRWSTSPSRSASAS